MEDNIKTTKNLDYNYYNYCFLGQIDKNTNFDDELLNLKKRLEKVFQRGIKWKIEIILYYGE